MSENKLRSLADFEWASVARYILYVSSIAGLCEINANHVVSFPLARLGPEKVLKQKRAVLLVLEGNKAAIEAFVGHRKSDLDENELAVLRTLYLQYRANIETVKGHIGFAETCVVELEMSLLKAKEEDENGIEF